MFLIGSRAAEHHGLKVQRDVSKSDWDIIGTEFELEFFLKKYNTKATESKFPGKFKIKIEVESQPDSFIEFDATRNESNEILNSLINLCRPTTFIIGTFKNGFFVPPQSILYMIKRSHANFNVNFDKTIQDLRAMMKQWSLYGLQHMMYHNSFYIARHKEAKERFGKIQERIKLNKPNDDFFMGGMNLRTYVHDDLHKAVAFHDGVPMFEKCKSDLNNAFIDKELFQQLSHDDQVHMAMEESMVIALEREYIPNRDKFSDLTERAKTNMYRKGMIKEIRDLCKGWFQDFMIDNILDIEKPKWDYVAKFEAALASGKIRRLEKDVII
jgi:hypothetical protein